VPQPHRHEPQACERRAVDESFNLRPDAEDAVGRSEAHVDGIDVVDELTQGVGLQHRPEASADVRRERQFPIAVGAGAAEAADHPAWAAGKAPAGMAAHGAGTVLQVAALLQQQHPQTRVRQLERGEHARGPRSDDNDVVVVRPASARSHHATPLLRL